MLFIRRKTQSANFHSSKHWTGKQQTSDLAFLVFISFFHGLTVVQVLFCSLIKGIPPKFADCVFVLINSVPLDLLCIWILFQNANSHSGFRFKKQQTPTTILKVLFVKMYVHVFVVVIK